MTTSYTVDFGLSLYPWDSRWDWTPLLASKLLVTSGENTSPEDLVHSLVVTLNGNTTPSYGAVATHSAGDTSLRDIGSVALSSSKAVIFYRNGSGWQATVATIDASDNITYGVRQDLTSLLPNYQIASRYKTFLWFQAVSSTNILISVVNGSTPELYSLTVSSNTVTGTQLATSFYDTSITNRSTNWIQPVPNSSNYLLQNDLNCKIIQGDGTEVSDFSPIPYQRGVVLPTSDTEAFYFRNNGEFQKWNGTEWLPTGYFDDSNTSLHPIDVELINDDTTFMMLNHSGQSNSNMYVKVFQIIDKLFGITNPNTTNNGISVESNVDREGEYNPDANFLHQEDVNNKWVISRRNDNIILTNMNQT